MIDLRCGRPVIAWDDEDEEDKVKGTFVCTTEYPGGSYARHLIIEEGETEATEWDNVELDPDGQPMNGDEVIGEYSGERIPGQYVGVDRKGNQIIDNERIGLVPCISARHPQPSTRERVIEFLNSYYYPCNAEKIADQIDKIYTEGS